MRSVLKARKAFVSAASAPPLVLPVGLRPPQEHAVVALPGGSGGGGNERRTEGAAAAGFRLAAL